MFPTTSFIAELVLAMCAELSCARCAWKWQPTQLPGPLCRECFEIKCMDTAPFTGRCITGDSAVSVIVQITDACPECAADHIDIQALTFNKLAPMNTGRINIMYR